MKYKNYPVIKREGAEKLFLTNDVEGICEALISLSFYEADWRWVQDKCLEFLNNENPDIRGVAATCLGHVARVHHKLDKEKVVKALRYRLNDDLISGRVEDALNDIAIFMN